MFRNSQNKEHNPSRESRRDLPPIRDLFGDVFEQSSHSKSQRDRNSSAQYYNRGARAHPNSQSFYPPSQLPPLRSHSVDIPTSSQFGQPWTGSHTQFSSHRDAVNAPRQSSSNHSYDIFVTSNSGLVHQRSSNKDDFRQMAKEEAISSSTGRHSCPECGRRFEKLSHYKSHLNSHSGEKPYQCSWPGCGKTFSASSNMRRHERTHGTGGDVRKSNTHDSEATQSKMDVKPHSQSYYHY